MKKLISLIAAAIAVGVFFLTSLALSNKEPENNEETLVDEKRFFDYSAATDNIEPVGDPLPVTPKLLTYGEWVFRGMCIGCHGPDGDGNGAVWELADKYAPEHKLPRKPRDFTQAVFKIRSTPSGSFPTDVDLFKSISRGLVADQDMPAFKFLPERDRWAVIAYIKSLSTLWEEEAEYQEDPIVIGQVPIPDTAMIVAGKGVYKKLKCAKCHGETGLGDGPSASDLTDDNDMSIVPRDFTDASQFVGSPEPAGVLQTFSTGFDGTPMPSFLDFLTEESGWQLVWYVTSLRKEFDLEKTREDMAAQRGIKLSQTIAVTAPMQMTSNTPSSGESSTEPVVTTQSATQTSGEAMAASDTDQAAPKTAPKIKKIGNYKEIEVSDGGSIQGKITYKGSVKKKTVIPSKDKKVCGKKRKVPLILVGEGGAVKDSVVYIKGVDAGKAWSEMELKPPVLNQENCQFSPHIQVGRQGTIDILNSDPVLHNTHGYYGTRTAFNVALPEKDQKISKLLKKAGTVKVDCDAHGWMLGWIQVVDSPYYFQTGEDGTFSITGIPPGDYTLVIWQEWLGEKEMAVTITAGGMAELNVELTK